MSRAPSNGTFHGAVQTHRRSNPLCYAGDYHDGSGLFLRVKTSGMKSWFYQWTAAPNFDVAKGRDIVKRPKKGLGAYPLVPLAKARDKADRCRVLVSEGIDPRVDTTIVAKLETFKDAAFKLFELKQNALKDDGDAGRWMSTLEHHVFPHILNGSPLFTGGAGSGESEIRRFILESDLLEAIVTLPTDMFYNTGISTYVWVLTNKKDPSRKGKVKLINGTDLYRKMRKSLGSKRKWMDEGDIATITRCFGNFEAVAAEALDKPEDAKSNRGRQSATPKAATPKTFASKIFQSHEFGYRRLTIERPLRESYQFSDNRIAPLRFAPKPLHAISQWIYDTYGTGWNEDGADYGVLTEHEIEIRTHIKAEFPELKEKQIKDALDPKTWRDQLAVLQTARALQAKIGTDQHDDMNDFDKALKAMGVALDVTAKKQITTAVSWKNPKAVKVIKKVHKNTPANPLYGLFAEEGQTVEYKPDGDLRDNENVPLDPSQPANAVNEAYFMAEVAPHVPDAWIDAGKIDAIDGGIGIVGYEIPFNRHFYTYTPPRDLAEIDAELDAVSAEIMALLQEVHVWWQAQDKRSIDPIRPINHLALSGWGIYPWSGKRHA